MARNPKPAASPPIPSAPSTQRAYTLRLCGLDANDKSWRDALWATHEAVNKGAKVFGEWLLTLRGGLDHALAEPTPPSSKKSLSQSDTVALRKNRRILLALSWLSVEDEHGAPTGAVRVTTGKTADSERKDKVLAAFRSILARRSITGQDVDLWIADCIDSLSARIRKDAVWINRSECFDVARKQIGASLTRDEAWDILEPFFASDEAYFAQAELSDSDTSEEKAKDLVQKAGQWLSSRFGTGKGADFESLAKTYTAMAKWASGARSFRTGAEALSVLGESLAHSKPVTTDTDGILALISGPGYKSATRNIVKAWGQRAGEVSTADLVKFAEVATKDAAKCSAKVGSKGRRLWSDWVLASVEVACGFTYLQKNGPARHSEFAVMLDHAARRVSIGHSWIKRAELERRRFETDVQRFDQVPSEATTWLDKFVRDRSGSSGATAAGSEYRIRRRAIEGWDEVIKRWKRAACASREDRVASAREAQADPEIEKFGDIQLFEALAAEDAECVWKSNGKADPQPLKDYVFGHDARDKMRRFKVPAFCHPDPFKHPVFCDFGNSRWAIEYAVHQAAKAGRGRRAPATSYADWLKDKHGLRMGLWNGSAIGDVAMRWSSKRFASDLALRSQGIGEPIQRCVARADRLGRAASGIKLGDSSAAAGLFALDDWNGRLQAPRAQLNAIAACLAENTCKWSDKAKKLRDRIKWLVTFSARLQCRGPFMKYAAQFGDDAPAKPFVSRKGELAVKHATNDNRQGHAKLNLSRLPGLRVLSVDLGHRFAATCAVWETLPYSALQSEISGKAVIDGGITRQYLYLHTRHTDARGKERTTIYRRIGCDKLADGSDHPAPWARLDRQFVIKLQGEDAPARKASPEEINAVREMETELGSLRGKHNPLPMRVDELMAEATRAFRRALRRLGDCARIAYAFKPGAARLMPGGGAAEHTPETRNVAMLDALMRWHDLATGDQWSDPRAKATWLLHIVPILSAELPLLSEEADRWERKRQRAALELALVPVAAALARDGAPRLHTLWSERWKTDNSAWRPRLKWLRSWLLPRNLRSVPGESAQQGVKRQARRGVARHVGGLSLKRIATIRELYQIQKAYAMRPEPDNLRKNIADKDDDRFDEFGRSVLAVVERLREQRVKQLASRIAEAALGIGRTPMVADRNRKRPAEQVDEPCHAVVIENLRNYRPDELQTRRENRSLMNWSAGKVRKYLEEACQLHGLYLREVMPNYTSRQCSRTGFPGLRCDDVPIGNFLNSPWWTKLVNAAEKRLNENRTDSLDWFIVALRNRWTSASEKDRSKQQTLRIPRVGGDLFVATASADSSNGSMGRVIQADLNAAANIGLRALLDPDFPAKWWYVPCIDDKAAGTALPRADKVKGSACFGPDPAKPEQFGSFIRPTATTVPEGRDGKRKRTPDAEAKETTNFWSDPNTAPLRNAFDAGFWLRTPAYWRWVRKRVVASLWEANGLTSGPLDLVPDPDRC